MEGVAKYSLMRIIQVITGLATLVLAVAGRVEGASEHLNNAWTFIVLVLGVATQVAIVKASGRSIRFKEPQTMFSKAYYSLERDDDDNG